MTRLTVIRAGARALVQDLGRPGLAHLGVAVSGAMDREAFELANRLVGNTANAAGLEILFGATELQSDEPLWIVVTGARGKVHLSGHLVQPHTTTLINPGERLVFGPAEYGIRYYLAVRGGINVAPVLGSRSRDTLAQLGPAPLVDGEVLQIGPEPNLPLPSVDLVPVVAPASDTAIFQLRPGPRRDWFAADAWNALLDSEWQVSPRSDRSGIRIEGPALSRTELRELPSEGMLPGAVQVSPDGAPTILAVDHPVTGGYPVIAVVTDDSLDMLAQLRPGQGIRFSLAVVN